MQPEFSRLPLPKKCLTLTREKDKSTKVKSGISSSASHTLRSIDKLACRAVIRRRGDQRT